MHDGLTITPDSNPIFNNNNNNSNKVKDKIFFLGKGKIILWTHYLMCACVIITNIYIYIYIVSTFLYFIWVQLRKIHLGTTTRDHSSMMLFGGLSYNEASLSIMQ